MTTTHESESLGVLKVVTSKWFRPTNFGLSLSGQATYQGVPDVVGQ